MENIVKITVACVAGGISRASAFVLVEKPNPSGEAVRGLVKSRIPPTNPARQGLGRRPCRLRDEKRAMGTRMQLHRLR